MLDFYNAREQLLQSIQTTEIEQPPLLDCLNRFLAQDIQAQHSAPPFTNSAMDGYALCLHENDSLNYELVARIAAGDDVAKLTLQKGQAARIFTGAPIPQGCNAVIAQENTTVQDHQLHCVRAPKLHDNIRELGEDFAVGTTMLAQGELLTPAVIGLLASQGYASLPVHKRLRVAVFSSGNELLEPTSTIRDGAIFDANRYQLLAWLKDLNCEVIDGGILKDELADSTERLANAAKQCDLIITSGGASVGEEDHMKAAIMANGELTHWKLAIKPGKPFAWGKIGQARVMMLPGNPVATFVTFKLLVEPYIKNSMGAQAALAIAPTLSAHATFSSSKPESRREFLRAQLWFDEQGVAHVDRLQNQGSHMLSACVAANALIEIAPDALIAKGERVLVHRLK